MYVYIYTHIHVRMYIPPISNDNPFPRLEDTFSEPKRDYWSLDIGWEVMQTIWHTARHIVADAEWRVSLSPRERGRGGGPIPIFVAATLGLETLPVLTGDWPVPCLLALLGLPVGVKLARLLGTHHAEPKAIQNSKFLALRPGWGGGQEVTGSTGLEGRDLGASSGLGPTGQRFCRPRPPGAVADPPKPSRLDSLYFFPATSAIQNPSQLLALPSVLVLSPPTLIIQLSNLEL